MDIFLRDIYMTTPGRRPLLEVLVGRFGARRLRYLRLVMRRRRPAAIEQHPAALVCHGRARRRRYRRPVPRRLRVEAIEQKPAALVRQRRARCRR